MLFNNEALRLDSVPGTVWILEYERDPTSYQASRLHWVIIEPATPLQIVHEAQGADDKDPERAPE